VYRIEAITVDETICRRKLRFNPNPDRTSPDSTKGMVRTFSVYYDEGTPTHGVEDVAEQAHETSWTVEVAYPVDAAKGEGELQDLILQDAFLLRSALRDPRYYDGTSATATTTETNLHRRAWMNERVDRDGEQTWYLVQTWSCTVFESE
jgi:hypothetical protein